MFLKQKFIHGISQPLKTHYWLIAFLALFLTIALIMGGIFLYNSQTQVIHHEKSDELQSIAALKIQQIIQWRQERIANAHMNAASPFFDQAIDQWLANPNDSVIRNQLLTRLQMIIDYEGYQNVILSTIDGQILLSLDQKTLTFDGPTKQLAIQTAHSVNPILGDFFRDPNDQQIYLDVAAPIFDNSPSPKAILILRTDPNKYLYPLIQSWPVPSQSAETLLVRKDGEQVIFLNTLRHNPTPPLSLEFPLNRIDIPAVQAVSGYSGEFEGHDYRGVDVLSEISPVPGTPWFMIAKVDKNEILGEVQSVGLAILLVVALAVVSVVLASILIFNYRQRKLYKDLFEAERLQVIAQEEIRTTLYSIGDGVITTDGKGHITRLNPVAEALTGLDETEAKGKSLSQVFQIINEMSRKEVENPVERVLREGIIVGLANHTLLLSHDGTERPIADSGAPIRNKDGEITGVVLVFRDQTQERNTQKERALLSYTIATSLNEIYLFDAQTLRFRFANMGALSNLGYSLDQMQKMSPLDIKPEITSNEFQQKIDTLLNYEKPDIIFETIHQRADGSRYPVEVHLQLFEYDLDKVFLAIVQDITERRKSASILLESENHFKSLFNNMTEGAALHEVVYNSEGIPIDYILVDANPQFEIQTGIRIDSAKGQVARIIYGTHTPPYLNEYVSVATSGKPVRMDVYFPPLNKYFEISIIPWGNGGFATIFSDITERKLSEQALIESEQRYHALFQNNHAVMLLINPNNGEIVDANPAASTFYGWTLQELAQININKINTLSPDEISFEMQMANEQKRNVFQLKHRKKDGEIRDVEVYSGPIQIKGEVYLYSVVHDITDRKAAEIKVSEQLVELRRWYNATLGRETRILEMKQEVNELLIQSGLPIRYANPRGETQHE